MDKYEMKKFLEISMPHEEMREKHVTLYDSIYKLEIAKETGVTEAIRWSPRRMGAVGGRVGGRGSLRKGSRFTPMFGLQDTTGVSGD